MSSVETPVHEAEQGKGPPISWPVVAAALAVAVALVPLLLSHGRQLWLRPHYQFFPVVLLGAAALAWQRLHALRQLPPGNRGLGYSLGALAWLLTATAVLLNSSWLGTIAALVLLAAVLVGVGGLRLFRLALPAWVLLWLVVPPPFELDRNLILGLQSFTSGCSSGVLDLLGIFHVMDGHVVEISGRRLLVEEACAGINSLFSVVACTLLFVFWVRRPLLWGLLLLAAAVVWVLAANVTRVVVIAYLFSRRGIDLASGWRHDALGLGLFGLVLLLVWSSDRLLALLAGGGRARPAPEPTPGEAPAPEAAGLGLGPWVTTAAFGALGVLGVFLNGPAAEGTGTAAEDRVGPVVERLNQDTLPEQLGGWQREQFSRANRNAGSAFGEFSGVWSYRQGGQQAILSLDYPFPGWHDLTRCYTSQGWVVEKQQTYRSGGATPVEYGVVWLVKPGHRSGYLVFAEFDRGGRPLHPRIGGTELSLGRHEQAIRRLLDRWHGTTSADAVDPPGPIYQLQLFAESNAPLNEAEQNHAQDLFLRSWEHLQAVVNPLPKPEALNMLVHNVYFALKDRSAAAKAKLVAACKQYLTGHPGTLFFAAGTLAEALDRAVNVRDFDVALHLVFTEQAAHDQYQEAPRHEQFIAENQDNWAGVRVFDSVVDG